MDKHAHDPFLLSTSQSRHPRTSHWLMHSCQVGIPVNVLEREGGPRREGSAIGLWPNAFRALDALGVAEPLRAAHPLFDRCMGSTLAPENDEAMLDYVMTVAGARAPK